MTMRSCWGRPIVLLAIVLGGCTTTPEQRLDTKEECTSADWQAVGLADGQAGQTTAHIATHRDSCAAYGVTPVLESYEKGYVQGVLEYCTKERGYVEGSRNRKYQNACPNEVEAAFLEGYADGLIEYRQQQDFRRRQMREGAANGQETVPQL